MHEAIICLHRKMIAILSLLNASTLLRKRPLALCDSSSKFVSQVLQNVPANAAAKVGMRVDNVAGVKIPVFEKHEQEVKSQDLTGLAAGGQKVEQSRTTFVSNECIYIHVHTFSCLRTVILA
jgi:vacuolar-type H+-ATPase subunit D/Vma8